MRGVLAGVFAALACSSPRKAGSSAIAPPPSELEWPSVPKHADKVLAPMKLVTLVAANDALNSELFAFSDDLAKSSWWSAIGTEYGVTPLGSVVHYSGPEISDAMTIASLLKYIEGAIASETAAAPDGNTLYLLYLPDAPDGSPVSVGESIDCAYHGPYPSRAASAGDAYAVVTRKCEAAFGESQLNVLTKVASHEIAEGATNPTSRGYNLGVTPEQPWTESVWSSFSQDKMEVEVADLCEETRIFEPSGDGATWEYQRIWSNLAATGGGDPCVPALPGPYYTVQLATEWHTAKPGSTVSIPLTGWSQQAVSDWLLKSRAINTSAGLSGLSESAGTIVLTSKLGIGTSAPCDPHPAMNQGVSGSLEVTLPATAKSGDYAVLVVSSFRLNSECHTPLSEDLDHRVPVGVYVP